MGVDVGLDLGIVGAWPEGLGLADEAGIDAFAARLDAWRAALSASIPEVPVDE